MSKPLYNCLLGTVQQPTLGWKTLTLKMGAHLIEDRPERDSALLLLSQGHRDRELKVSGHLRVFKWTAKVPFWSGSEGIGYPVNSGTVSYITSLTIVPLSLNCAVLSHQEEARAVVGCPRLEGQSEAGDLGSCGC